MAETKNLNHNIEYTCRTCMKRSSSKQNLTPLFIGELACLSAHPEVLEEIAFFGLDFNENDGLPQILCADCLGKFSDIRKFRKRCEDVQDMLKVYFIGSMEIKAEKNDDIEIEFVDVDIKNESETLKNLEYLENPSYVPDSEHDQYSNSDSMSDDENNIDLDVCKIELENETKCKICDEEFQTSLELEDHLKVIHKNDSSDSEIKCEECNRTYKSKQHLKRHVIRIHTKADFQCSICKKKFTNNFRFKYHMASHASKKKYQCQYCDKSFLQSNHKKIHEMSHTGERPYLCCFCGKNFRYESRYKEHLVRYHRDEDIREIVGDAMMQKDLKPVRSLIPRNKNGNERSKECSSTDDGDTELNENTSSEYSCKNCHKNYSTLVRLNKHIKCCKKRKNVGCDICTLQFASEVLYQKHKESHSIDSLPFCPICSQTFEAAENRDDHLVSAHDTRENSRCDICHQLSMSKLKLLKHRIRIHPIGDYECPVCNNKKFSYYHHYNIHMRKHIKNFKCNYCDKYFYTPYKVVLHERVHSDKKPHLCTVCGMTFKNTSDLNQHSHNDQYNFKCSECDEAFLTRKKLGSHMKRRHKSKRDIFGKIENECSKEDSSADDNDAELNENESSQYSCKNCHKNYSTLTRLNKHIKCCKQRKKFGCDICVLQFESEVLYQKHKESHSIDSLPFCPICSQTFENAEERHDHMVSTHDTRENSRCDICHKLSTSKLKLLKHKIRIHPIGEYECPVCKDEKFSYYHLYNIHMRKHIKNFKCNYCGKLFYSQYKVVLHERIHTGEQPHLCNVCGMTFRNVSDLNQHLDCHNDQNNFKCSECDEAFLTRKKLGSHMQRWHKSKREPCDICGKVFRVRQLAIHKYDAHNGEKPPSQVADRSYPFNCPVCSKGFLAASSLLAHSKVHMNDRKHVCQDCGARYKRADHLTLHIKRAHLNVKNHSCDVCGKKFLEKCALKGHMVVHLKTRPFKCSQCPCDFKTNRSLQTHIRTHTGESPHGCGICEQRFPNRRLLVLHTMTHSQEQIKEIEVVVANAVGGVEPNDDMNLNYVQYS